jgi:hypothetical protein
MTLLLPCLHQESPQLIQIIRKNHIRDPVTEEPYNLTFSTEEFHRNPRKYGGQQAIEVDDLVFKAKVKGGFFIEAGAHDFQDQSTSLYFELKYNWTGLLVEPNQFHYKLGLATKRKVFSAETCFSFLPRPTELTYSLAKEMMHNNDEENWLPKVQCLPLYSLLLALGKPTVNYLSLDIEGGEFQVLQTIPWNKVDIEVISIESHFLGIRTPGSVEDLTAYMKDKGYVHIPGAHKESDHTMVEEVTGVSGHITNELFVREDIAKEVKLIQ